MRALVVGDIRAFSNGVLGVVIGKTGRYYSVMTLQGAVVKVKTSVSYASVRLEAKDRQKLEQLGKHYKKIAELIRAREKLEVELDEEWRGINKVLGRPLSTPRPMGTLPWLDALNRVLK